MPGVDTDNSTPSVDEHEHDEDFAAGFSGDATTETPVEPQQKEPEAPAPEYVQLTKSDFEKLMATANRMETFDGTVTKKFDTAFGQMGAMRQLIDSLKARTPDGEPVQVGADDFKELSEEYPELGELTLKGLNRVLGKVRGTGADPQAIDKIVGERLQSVESKIVDSALQAVFPGWDDEIKTPQFGAWLQQQAPETQALGDSTRIADAAKLLRMYEKSKVAPPMQPTTTQQSNQATTSRRQLAAAVPPKGDGGIASSASSDDDDFSAGFNYRSRGS